MHGDRPTEGDRAGGLTVRTMIDEVRASADQPEFAGITPFRVGVTAGHGRRLPSWKRAADVVFVQVGYSVAEFLRWRELNPDAPPVYAGVMVLASEAMAKRLQTTIPDIVIPDELVARVAADRHAGVEIACEQVLALRATGAFDGVHLVPVSRYRPLAARLEELLVRG